MPVECRPNGRHAGVIAPKGAQPLQPKTLWQNVIKVCKTYLKIELYKPLKEQVIYKRTGLLVPCVYQQARSGSGVKSNSRGKTAWCPNPDSNQDGLAAGGF